MKYKFLLLLPFMFLMSGCYNYTELNEMSIVSGISIDKEDEIYKVGFLITNAGKTNTSSENNTANMTLLSGKGKTITEAVNDLDLKNPKRYYLGHLSSLVVSKEVADDMSNVVDYFLRNPESLKRFYLVVCEDKAIDALKVISPQEILPSENIVSNIKEINEEQAVVKDQIYSKYIIDVLNNGVDPFLPVVTIKGKVDKADDSEDLGKTEVKTNVEIKSLALFRNYKLVYVTTKDEARGINVVNNNVNNLYLNVKYDDGNIISNVNNIKTKIDYVIKDGKPIFNINVSGNINIRESTCDCDLEDTEILNSINSKYENDLKKLVLKGIKVSQKYGTDVFGFGNLIYKKDYDYWIKNEDVWRDVFSNTDVKVKVKLKIVSSGAVKNTIGGLKNE